MSVSVFSFFTAILWSCVFVMAGAVLQRRKGSINVIHFLLLLVVSVLSLVRLFIPIELPFTVEVKSTVIYPKIMWMSRTVLISFGDYDVTAFTALIVIWILGIIVYLGSMIVHYVQFLLSMRYEEKSTDSRIQAIMNMIIAQCRSNTKVDVIQSRHVNAPIITGLFKPVIYLPDVSLTDKELEYILRHEWIHYIQKDLWIKLIFNIICAVYWWNPLMYLLKTDINHLLELKSDMYLAKQLSQESRTQYLEVLLKCARNLSSRTSNRKFSEVGVGFVSSESGRKIKQRFYLVDSVGEMSVSRKFRKMCACVMTLIIFVLSFSFVIQPYDPNPPEFYEPDSGIFSINEDTAYLIDNHDGSYALYSDGIYVADINKINEEPFSLFPIKQCNIQ